MTELYLGRFDRADAVFERGISVARSTGHGHVTTLNRIGQAYILLWRGEIAAAARLLDEASEAALLTGNDQFLAWALSAASWAAILAGDIPEALRLGERAMDSTPATPDPVSALAAAHLAEARLEAGEPPEACREQLLAAVGGERIALFERGFKPHVQEILARIELAAGNMDEAEEWAARATEAAAGMGILGRSAEAARARAAVALARGDRERAAAAALEAAELCAEGAFRSSRRARGCWRDGRWRRSSASRRSNSSSSPVPPSMRWGHIATATRPRRSCAASASGWPVRSAPGPRSARASPR